MNQGLPQHYFETELRKLKEHGVGSDPNTERLLEGAAFLTAKIRQEMDRKLPELSEALLSQFCPEFLKPYPSRCISRFTPRPGQLQKSYNLKEGAVLQSQAVGIDQTQCRFSTAAEHRIDPLEIQDVSYSEPSASGAEILISIQAYPGVYLNELDINALTFYIHSDKTQSSELRYLLLAKTEKVAVSFDQRVWQGLDSKPCQSRANIEKHNEFNVLRQWFCFAEAFNFITLSKLNNITWPQRCAQITLKIHCSERLKSSLPITRDNFLLHCLPVINSYEMDAEPIILTNENVEYSLYPDKNKPNSVFVHDVIDVVGIDNQNLQQQQYLPLAQLQHRQNNSPFYHLSQNYLSFGGLSQMRPQTISSRLQVHNGDLPAQYLQEKELTAASNIPTFLTAENITQPTKCLSPPSASDYQWQLVSKLSQQLQSIDSVAALRQALSQHNWSDKTENDLAINAISAVDQKTKNTVKQGALVQCIQFDIELDDAGFTSFADCYHFAAILHQFLSLYAPINYQLQTKVLCQPSKQVHQFQDQPGMKKVI